MSINATSLNKKFDLNKRHILSNVSSINAVIIDKIVEANRDGKFNTRVELPIRFSAVTGITNADLQRIIYYNVVNHFVKLGYNVEIEILSNKTNLDLNWLTDDIKNERTLQNEFLARYTKKSNS